MLQITAFVASEYMDYYSSGDGSDDDQYQFLNYERVSESKSTTEFRVITAQEIREDQQRLVEEIASCLAVPVSSAGVLLRYFRCSSFRKQSEYCPDFGTSDGTKKNCTKCITAIRMM